MTREELKAGLYISTPNSSWGAWNYTIPRRARILSRWLAFTAILRYLVTGYCGYGGCGYATLYCYWDHCRRCVRNDVCQYSGEQVRLFVPEAGCPVHDSDTRLSQWARKARRGQEQPP